MGIFTLAVILAVLLAAGLALALIKPQGAKRIAAVFLLIAAVGGSLIYGYGYLTVSESWLLAILRIVPAVSKMFLGSNNLADIQAAPLMGNRGMQTLFWIIHCYAIYTTLSTVVTAVGGKMIKNLRLRLAVKRPVHLLYGVNEKTLALGRKLAQNRSAVVFVDAGAEEGVKAEGVGGVFCSDGHALQADREFLRSIGLTNKRQILLYALKDDPSDNLRYAQLLKTTLQQMEIEPEQTRLVIAAREDVSVDRLQIGKDRYGYGFVTAVQEPALAARLLCRNYPPCRHIAFDAEGKATEDFEALIIGFGQAGQAVLKSLVLFGQFEGSAFRGTVFAPDCQIIDGRIQSQFEELFDNYQITLNSCDARSKQLYRHVQQRGNQLKYAVICTGNEKLNRELAEELSAYCKRLNLTLPVYICTRNGVSACDADGVVVQQHALYEPEALSNHRLDQMAMLLNYRYQGSTEQTPLQAWMDCDYFSRQSCRAAADFVDSMLYIAAKNSQQVLAEGWQLSQVQLENLSKTEHLRWCAFHYCMNFKAMDKKTFASRGEEYLRQQRENGKPSIRIGKDMANRLHACLVDWEELDALAEREEKYTGKRMDYKAMDTNNVLAIAELLRAKNEA